MKNHPKSPGRGPRDMLAQGRQRDDAEPADSESELVDGEDTILGELTDSFRWRFDPDLSGRSGDTGEYLGRLDLDDALEDLADYDAVRGEQSREDSDER